MSTPTEFKYPRKRFVRWVLKPIINLTFNTLTDMTIIGKENIPEKGPLIVVGNHFNFADPAAVIRALPYSPEFIGGNRNPAAPKITFLLPRLWGFYPVFRGTGSTYALRASVAVIKQDGILCIFPEGGSWAEILRPARPGTAYIAAKTGAKILPIGIDGMPHIFDELKKGRRAKTTLNIGEPFGPFKVTGRGRERRKRLDAIGDEIMQRIADLIPPERRGHFSDDPAIREAAKGTEIYPWDTMTEMDFKGGEQLDDLKKNRF